MLAFGMHFEVGKGSHKKFTFENVLSGSRRILDKEKNEVFRFPDITNASYAEGAMMVIPRWDGNQPPDYIIGALRHILEKRGANTSNVFKKNKDKAEKEN